MMLVDTHVVVWLAWEANRLSKAALGAINAAREQGEGLAIAAISLYELAVLAARGRIQLDVSIESFLQEVEKIFIIKPLTARIAARALSLPDRYPKDPMDRIIGATALVEGLRLVTADEGIRTSKAVRTVW
jgi:PIN domain nuclease of toxin-antitoxin system